jgi:hypothetical protein
MRNKKATLKIQLVSESHTVSDEQLKKEITKSLNCDWLLKIQNIE